MPAKKRHWQQVPELRQATLFLVREHITTINIGALLSLFDLTEFKRSIVIAGESAGSAFLKFLSNLI